MQADSEEKLVARARQGDTRAFGALIDRHLPFARRMARSLVGSPAVAQELAQEAMLQAYLSLAHLRDGARFQSWLGGIVLNVCRGYLRDQKADGLRLAALPPALAPDPARLAEERERRRQVWAAVEALSPENQAAVRLFYDEQRSLREIADALGISIAAVKGRLHKSRLQLRAALAPFYPDRAAPLPRRHRRKRMVRVTVNGVYLHKDEEGNELHFVLLLDQAGQRSLQIYIGKFEAWMISLGQENGTKERPMTYDFVVSLLGETGARVEEVRIQSLKDETFYAVVRVRVGDALREIDARPSDALALAVRTDTPVFVADDILGTVGRDYSAYNSLGEWLGRTGRAENMANLADEGALTRIAYAIVQQAIQDGATEIRIRPAGTRDPHPLPRPWSRRCPHGNDDHPERAAWAARGALQDDGGLGRRIVRGSHPHPTRG